MPVSPPVERLGLDGVAVTVAEAGTRPILEIGHLGVAPGEIVGLSGPSGAGKTTLLSVAAGLSRPARGRVMWGEADIAAWPEAGRDRWRRATLGMVFQDFALLPELSAEDNVLLPLSFDHWRPPAEARAEAHALMARMGLCEPDRRAGLLSRGERQRLAVARALIRRPALLLADEPTASLDQASGGAVFDLLVEMARERGATLIAVSHDGGVLKRCDRVLRLEQGRLMGDAPP